MQIHENMPTVITVDRTERRMPDVPRPLTLEEIACERDNTRRDIRRRSGIKWALGGLALGLFALSFAPHVVPSGWSFSLMVAGALVLIIGSKINVDKDRLKLWGPLLLEDFEAVQDLLVRTKQHIEPWRQAMIEQRRELYRCDLDQLRRYATELQDWRAQRGARDAKAMAYSSTSIVDQLAGLPEPVANELEERAVGIRRRGR